MKTPTTAIPEAMTEGHDAYSRGSDSRADPFPKPSGGGYRLDQMTKDSGYELGIPQTKMRELGTIPEDHTYPREDDSSLRSKTWNRKS